MEKNLHIKIAQSLLLDLIDNDVRNSYSTANEYKNNYITQIQNVMFPSALLVNVTKFYFNRNRINRKKIKHAKIKPRFYQNNVKAGTYFICSLTRSKYFTGTFITLVILDNLTLGALIDLLLKNPTENMHETLKKFEYSNVAQEILKNKAIEYIHVDKMGIL